MNSAGLNCVVVVWPVVVVVLADRKSLRGYLNPSRLGANGSVDLLSPDGEHTELPFEKLRSIYFVRDFEDEFEPERKAFLSRPKLDGDVDCSTANVPRSTSPSESDSFFRRARARKC